ncbi:MAG TPA: tRNA (adenosine(37)-N6)-dimethylallyltransferase MiaA [Candidatus Saccharimonadales bacterium]|nr:tRNA (adenosine(37)-N6)-dimethylallyltransferase MiaA [Candidatus Saccharimonadales bacterium]
MESVTDNPPVIVIVGQTASGKSALGLRLALECNGEIIAADSRTVYKGMDIGTAKPTAEERRMVPHHLIDVVSPDEPFTVADFQRQARRAIDTIAACGHIPFIVGGSGLYVDALLYNFSFRPPAQPNAGQSLECLSISELQSQIIDRQLPMPINRENRRHLMRTLQTNGLAASREELRPNTLILGIRREREELLASIARRVDAMVESGFVDEVRRLAEHYGWDTPALQAPGYRAFRMYLAGSISLDQAKQDFIHNDAQYAKRQQTWFKRNPDINWISKMEEAVDLVTTFLNK